jgi:hypothetical protein
MAKRSLRAFLMASSSLHVPTEDSQEVLATTKPPKTPSYAMWFSGESTSFPTHSQPSRSRRVHSTVPSIGMPRLASTTYYVRSYPYRLMVILFSWVIAP